MIYRMTGTDFPDRLLSIFFCVSNKYNLSKKNEFEGMDFYFDIDFMVNSLVIETAQLDWSFSPYLC